MKPRLLIVGAGGHARVLVALALQTNAWEIAGIIDRVRPDKLELIGGVAVLGSFDDASRLYHEGNHHAVLAVGDNDERAQLFARFSSLGFAFPILQHPSSLIEISAQIGEGCIICAGAILGVQTKIGRNVILNTGAILDHETIVDDHAHIAPGCRVAGRVHIGTSTMLGIGTCVRDKINIGAHSIIGAGSVVVADIPSGVIAYGNPARVARSRTL